MCQGSNLRNKITSLEIDSFEIVDTLKKYFCKPNINLKNFDLKDVIVNGLYVQMLGGLLLLKPCYPIRKRFN